ncbi:hypothetical protein [Micromonospora cremea]|uniref:hypothetical protein n=1 Tax=Micromonospora cremea TaxID=709881 RepID=UPI001FCAF2C3|nr:hypothetical protein [Micromonospora cremea]
MDLAAAGWQLAHADDVVAHHLPLPAGRDGLARRRMETRNRLLTALLRRPAGVVLRTAAAVARDAAGRGGLLDAGRELGWALRGRRRLPAEVEAALRTLARCEAGEPVAPPPARVAPAS